MHYHRRLGIYLRINHGWRNQSGKITPRQRRRLWRKHPVEMRERRAAYAGVRKQRDWS